MMTDQCLLFLAFLGIPVLALAASGPPPAKLREALKRELG